jgi:hypothetical protein
MTPVKQLVRLAFTISNFTTYSSDYTPNYTTIMANDDYTNDRSFSWTLESTR